MVMVRRTLVDGILLGCLPLSMGGLFPSPPSIVCVVLEGARPQVLGALVVLRGELAKGQFEVYNLMFAKN